MSNNLFNNCRFLVTTVSLTFYCFFINCEKDLSPMLEIPIDKDQPKPIRYSTELKGQVYLENQTEHSNALVYIDSLNRGVGTDSTGYFCFQFTDSDSIYNDQFTVYYFLRDYDLDSAHFQLEKGKVILDSCDVDSNGSLTTKYMEQILLVDGWTNRQEYKIGDTLIFTARFSNLTLNRTIHIFIPSVFSQLGHIVIARDDSIPYFVSPDYIITNQDLDLYLHAGGLWTGTDGGYIPAGQRIGNIFYPVLPGEYIVLHS